jgi:hypothetical protein
MPKNDEPDEAPKEPRRSRASFLSYHSPECSICRHPERFSIDQEFLEWGAVSSIAAAYRIRRRAIYRHAHATNLFERRNRDLRFALGRIIEHAGAVPVTADSIVRAVRLFACLNHKGGWTGPPTRSPLAPAVKPPRRASSIGPRHEPAANNPADPSRPPDAANANGRAASQESAAHRSPPALRSTHPNEQNTTQLIENTRSESAQIDTDQTHENAPPRMGQSAPHPWKPPTLVGGGGPLGPRKGRQPCGL